MNRKKIIVILSVFMLLFIITNVSAADTNTTDDKITTSADLDSIGENMAELEDLTSNSVNDEDSGLLNSSTHACVDNVEENDKLSASSTDEELSEGESDTLKSTNDNALGDDGKGTFSELSAEIGSGGDIVLTKKLYAYDFGSTIVISNSGTIDGNGAVIDMNGSSIITFEVNTSGVTFKNLIIKNAKCKFGDGAGISFNYYGTVENCSFTNNYGYYGGAIFFNYNGTVENCNFTDNYGNLGGGIYFRFSGNVSNCNFYMNTAYYSGAAIDFEGSGNVILLKTQHLNMVALLASGIIVF